MKVKKKLALPWQILIGFAIGIALGMVFKENVLKIKVIGDIFMKLLKMLVMPLVFFSIIDGITGIKDTKKFRSISVKTFSYFIINTLIASSEAIKSNWRASQEIILQELLKLSIYDEHFDQQILGKQLELSTSALSKRLKSSNIKVYLRTRNCALNLFKNAGEELN